MTAVKHAEQDARLDKLDATDREFLGIVTQLVAENKELKAELAQLRTLTKANGIGLHRLTDRVERLEGEG